MTSRDLYKALLRPAVLQILRATGFNQAKPAVVETVTDLAARYLLLLAETTAQNAFNTHNDFYPTIQDVRLALSGVGALYPQMSTAEENVKDDVFFEGDLVPFEDLRGVEGFVGWVQGSVNKEIRRIAGVSGDEISVEQIAAGTDSQEDYLTAMKKHGKVEEDSRYQGTILGQDAETQTVTISGGQVSSLSEYMEQFKSRAMSPGEDEEAEIDAEEAGASPATATSMLSSAPITPREAEGHVEPAGESSTSMSHEQAPT